MAQMQLARYPYLDRLYRRDLPISVLRPLAIVGAVYLASRAVSFSVWSWIHLIRRGDVRRYLDDRLETWALVTGASAGIGKGFAQELASQGFNVVLHGRSETKLSNLKTELQTQFPDRSFKLFVLDADGFNVADMEAALESVRELNLRVLVNNVGGGGKHEKPMMNSLQDRTGENVDGLFNVTARFTTHLTRLLLPTLIAKKSSLILNIGSGISDLNVAYLSVYAGLKSYLKHWSECLQLDLLADGNAHVEVLSITVGQTATERQDKKLSLTVPSSRQMARSSLAATGCGRPVIAAYFGHALQDAIVASLPTFLTQNMVLNLSRQMKSDEAAGKILL